MDDYKIPGWQIDFVAQSIYYANWKQLSNERFPPRWENVSDEVRDFVGNQAVRAIISFKGKIAITPEIIKETEEILGEKLVLNTHFALDRTKDDGEVDWVRD